MCVTMPGWVLEIEARDAVVDIDGRAVHASPVLFPELAPGDWVMVAAGTIVDRLNTREAARIRTALRSALAEGRTKA